MGAQAACWLFSISVLGFTRSLVVASLGISASALSLQTLALSGHLPMGLMKPPQTKGNRVSSEVLCILIKLLGVQGLLNSF